MNKWSGRALLDSLVSSVGTDTASPTRPRFPSFLPLSPPAVPRFPRLSLPRPTFQPLFHLLSNPPPSTLEFSSFLTPSNASFPPTLPFARSYTLLSSFHVFRPSLFIVTLGRSSVTRHLYMYNPLPVFTFLFLPVLCAFFAFSISLFHPSVSFHFAAFPRLLLSHGSPFFSHLRPFVILRLFLRCSFFRYFAVSFHFTAVPSFALACLPKRFFSVTLTPLSVYLPRSLLRIFHLSPPRVHRSSFVLPPSPFRYLRPFPSYTISITVFRSVSYSSSLVFFRRLFVAFFFLFFFLFRADTFRSSWQVVRRTVTSPLPCRRLSLQRTASPSLSILLASLLLAPLAACSVHSSSRHTRPVFTARSPATSFRIWLALENGSLFFVTGASLFFFSSPLRAYDFPSSHGFSTLAFQRSTVAIFLLTLVRRDSRDSWFDVDNRRRY